MNAEEVLTVALKTTGYDIYPQLAPENKNNPMVIYNATSSDITTGVNCSIDKNVRFQVDIYADSYKEVKDMKVVIYNALHTQIDKTIAEVVIFGSSDSADSDNGLVTRRTKLDLRIWIK